MTSPKEMEIASQATFENGRWEFSFQACLRSEKAADLMIEMLNIVRPLLAENSPNALGKGESGK